MTTEALKSGAVTNWDATPPVQNNTGAGAPGQLRAVSGYVTATTGKTAGSTYALTRFPSNAKIKHVFVGVDGTVTTFTNDIGVSYSTSTTDGTTPDHNGDVLDADAFGAAVDLKTAGLVDYVGGLAAAKRNQPAWQALGLSSDPGGYFDLVLTNTATNSGAPVAYGEVQYVL